MKSLRGREKIILLVLGIVTVGAVFYSADSLLVKGVLSGCGKEREVQVMAAEAAALFGLFTAVFRLPDMGKRAGQAYVPLLFRRRRGRLLAAGGVMALFLWAHIALVPVAVSGLYGAYLCSLGGWLDYRLLKGAAKGSFCRFFLTGCMGTVGVFCFMSALSAGRIGNLWIFVLAMTAVMAADREFWRSWRGRIDSRLQGWSLQEPSSVGTKQALMAAAVLTIFCIQAGRMNIAVDFDSLWYGVRSPYILDNGNGIYENMGTIGIVYTYSKGFEVLTLPLSILPSYSFGISFNLWLAAGILMLSFMIGRIYMEDGLARVMTLFLAAMPGIMNMSITAKSDIATLCFQLIMFYEMLFFVKGDRRAFWYSLASFFFTWTLKPTALVFSTAVMGMSGLYLIRAGRFFSWKNGDKREKKAAAVTFLSLLVLGGIWARTWLITGLPVTSVFSSVLTKIGFEMKYPFQIQKVPNSGQGLSLTQWGGNMIKRLYGILLNPQGEDMSHVILAWSGPGMWFLLWVWFLWLFLEKKGRKRGERQLDVCLNMVFLPFLACSLISLALLTQVDGNYFMLFYVLCTVYVFRSVSRIKQVRMKSWFCRLAALVMTCSVIVMSLTNWSWTRGFTPASWLHRGYYDHQKIQKREMEEEGKGSIWDILAKDSRNRLISIGDHPEALLFPCNAQSYLDITGTWGNVVLVKYMDNFVEFMKYAKTDYVYAQAGYIAEEERAWSLTCDLIEYGILIPVCYEQGNMLAAVDVEGQRTAESAQALGRFKELYRKKGQ